MPRRPVTPVAETSNEASPAPPDDLDLSPLAAIVAAVPDPESGLIGILQKVQAVYGYLPEPVVVEVARQAHVPASRIFGVVTFYAQFSTVPSGRNKVCVCQGTACHVRGGHGVLRAVEGKLGLMPGQTSEDLAYTLETVACLGACSLAPVVTVNGQYYGKLTGSKALAALEAATGDDGDDESEAGDDV
jgi:NADH-quinone oxidoreductase subunit E